MNEFNKSYRSYLKPIRIDLLNISIVVSLIVAFISQSVRQKSIVPGVFRSFCVWLLGFTDSMQNQWIFVLGVSLHFITYTVLILFLHRNLDRKLAPSFSTEKGSEVLWSRLFFEIAIVLFLLWALFKYANDYAVSHHLGDFLALISGMTLGQVFAVLRLVRSHIGSQSINPPFVFSLLIFVLVVAAIYHPDMGRTFYYRESVRWMGPFFNPNTFGLLMGMGLVLAVGKAVEKIVFPAGPVPVTVLVGRRPVAHSITDVIMIGAYLVAAGIMIFALIRCYSRGAWMGALIAFGYLAISFAPIAMNIWRNSRRISSHAEPGRSGLSLKQNLSKSTQWLLYFPGSVVVGLSILCLAYWSFRNTEFRLVRRLFSVGNLNDFSWRNRITTAEGALQMMADRPWAGYGWNKVLPDYLNSFRPPKLFEGWAILLNDYNVIGVTLGLPALALLVLYILFKFWRGHFLYFSKRGAPNALDWEMSVCRAACLVFMAGFLVERGMFYIALSAPFWILLQAGSGPLVSFRSDVVRSESRKSNATPAREPDSFKVFPRPARRDRKPVLIAFATPLCVSLLVFGMLVFLDDKEQDRPKDAEYTSLLDAFRAAHPLAVSISPDGLYVLRKEEVSSGFRLSVWDTEQEHEVDSSSSVNTQRALTWRPDSRAIIYQDSSGLERPLYLWDLETGDHRRLDVPVSRTALPPLRWDSLGIRLAYFHGDWRSGRLLVIDTTRNAPSLVAIPDLAARSDYVWCPEGSRIVIADERRPGVLQVFNWRTMEVSEVWLKHSGAIRDLAWAPNGDSLLAVIRGHQDEYFKLYEIALDSGEASLLAEFAGDLSLPVWLPDGESFLYHHLSDGIQQVRIGSRSDPRGRLIGPSEGVVHIAGIAHDGAYAHARYASTTSPPVQIRVSLVNGDYEVIDSPVRAAEVTIPSPHSIRVESYDGTTIPAFHWRATDLGVEPQAALITVHGGLHTQTYPTWESFLKMMLQNACDVIAVNFRGSSGYGRSFERLGDSFDRVQDILAFREFSLNQIGVPADRIFLMGHSSGGSLAAAAATQGEEVGGLALVSWAGPIREIDPRIDRPFPIIQFHGEMDASVSAIRAREAAIDWFSRVMDPTEIDWHLFPEEGHFFYKTESWANVYWGILEMIRKD